MPVMTPSDLIHTLNWRYATKKFDPDRKISPDLWKTLEEALVLTPSSFGLQPWKFIVITDPDVKARLRPVSWGQSQVEDCSHLVVFTARESMREDDIDRYVDRIAEVREVPVASLSGYADMMKGSVIQGPLSKVVEQWTAKQAYIALGNFMTCAAALGVDTCPIEGLDPAQYDEILELSGTGYRTLAVCPAGYRAHDDAYAKLAKVRFPMEQVIERI